MTDQPTVKSRYPCVLAVTKANFTRRDVYFCDTQVRIVSGRLPGDRDG